MRHGCFPTCVSGLVKYDISVKGASTATLKVTLMDKDRHCVTSSSDQSGVLKVVDVNLWWPYLMHENPGYLYTLEVRACVYVRYIQVSDEWVLPRTIVIEM